MRPHGRIPSAAPGARFFGRPLRSQTAVRGLGAAARLLVIGIAVLAGCVTATPGDPGSATAEASAAGTSGLGSLRQEEFTVELEVDGVRVRLTPLDPDILRLAAPDTRRRLESLGGGRDGTLFLVSVFTEEPGGAEFESRGVSLENRGRVFRPTSIRGLTPGWGVRLEQRRAEQALYAFSPEVDLELTLTIEVGGVRSDAWGAILPRLDVERARVRARGGQPSSPNFRIFR